MPTPTAQRVAENVRVEMARQKRTVAQLVPHIPAEVVKRRTLYRMVNGETDFSPAAIEAVALALGVTVDSLFGLEQAS